MDRDELRKAMQDSLSTPGQRLKDWVVLKLAQAALIIILIWVLTHLDEIVNWLNGK